MQCVKLTPGSHEQVLVTPSTALLVFLSWVPLWTVSPADIIRGLWTCTVGDGRTAREKEPEFLALWGDHTRPGPGMLLLLGRAGINYLL